MFHLILHEQTKSNSLRFSNFDAVFQKDLSRLFIAQKQARLIVF